MTGSNDSIVIDTRAIVHREIDMPDGSGKLIVLNWSSDGPKRLRNLVRVDTAGDEIWTAESPQGISPDCFTNVSVGDGAIHASTWSGSNVLLDRGTGKIVAVKFTK
jgi:hypothetical protein